MNAAEINQLLDVYHWLIPNKPVEFSSVIETLKQRFQATELDSSQIPNLKMHQFNALHLPKNEELHLCEAQLHIQAIRIPITPQTKMYTERDFVPPSSDSDGKPYIYLAYETQVGYCRSNSNRLFLECRLMQGISPSEREQNTERWRDFIFFLKTYDESYGSSLG